MQLCFLAKSLICGCKSYSKYPVFTSVTVSIVQGLRSVSRGFDDWRAPLWVLEKDTNAGRHNPEWLCVAAPCKYLYFNCFYLSAPHFRVPQGQPLCLLVHHLVQWWTMTVEPMNESTRMFAFSIYLSSGLPHSYPYPASVRTNVFFSSFPENFFCLSFYLGCITQKLNSASCCRKPQKWRLK